MNVKTSKTEIEIANLTGRIAALETMNATMLAHLFVQFDDPVAFASHVLIDIKTNLLAAQQRIPDTDRQAMEAARAALLSFEFVSKSMLELINRISEPAGRA